MRHNEGHLEDTEAVPEMTNRSIQVGPDLITTKPSSTVARNDVTTCPWQEQTWMEDEALGPGPIGTLSESERDFFEKLVE